MVEMLALTELIELSTLEDEFERERLEVWFVVTLALTEWRDRSTEDDEFEREMEEVLY